MEAGPHEAGPLPPSFVMECPQHGAPLAFKLPCLIGSNLIGTPTDPGIHAMECDLLDSPVRTVMGILVPMVKLPALLNQELKIPFDGLPSVPYALQMEGTAVFTEADPSARTLSGRLVDARVHPRGDDPGQEACTIDDQPLWAMPGDFL